MKTGISLIAVDHTTSLLLAITFTLCVLWGFVVSRVRHVSLLANFLARLQVDERVNLYPTSRT